MSTKYNLDYTALNDLADEIMAMPETIKEHIKPVAEEIGRTLKSNTEQVIPRLPEPKHNIHLADDVKLTVKVDDKKAMITVKGGNKTGKLWWPIDAGHINAKNGKWVGGLHFTDKAYQMTDVEGPMEALIQEIVNDEH